jgi:hypothetical protein
LDPDTFWPWRWTVIQPGKVGPGSALPDIMIIPTYRELTIWGKNMKKILGALVVLCGVGVFTSNSADAFSVSARTYSGTALKIILASADVINAIPASSSITSVEQVSTLPYEFNVRAGQCTLVVDVSTTTPVGFIGNGFPHDPKVVDATGCN